MSGTRQRACSRHVYFSQLTTLKPTQEKKLNEDIFERFGFFGEWVVGGVAESEG